MNITEIYRHAYRMFGSETPIAADCGRLCRSRCCRGSAGDGMLLFPGEEQVSSDQTFLKVEMREMRGLETGFAVCSGRCMRPLRPLSCRIFPYAPRLEGGKISVRKDPRAKRICPLLTEDAEEFIQQSFLDKIVEVFEFLLSAIPEMENFLTEYSAMLDEYERFL